MRKLIVSAPLALAPLFVALGCSGGGPAKAPPAAARAAPAAAATKAEPPPAPLPPPEPAAVQRAVHALNRLGYGPRPGEAEAVARAGVDAWVARQLEPASIDDRAFEARLARLSIPSLSMSTAELQEHYPRPKAAKKAAAMAALGAGGAAVADEPKMKPAAIVQELAAQKLLRAVASERQLQEVLVDFWFNHFNVFAEKDKVRWYVTSYERDVIRPRIFGRFRDLLGATARSPAMLVYLDNYRSVAEGAAGRGKARGLNENYARELLELHTLGVDGGYTQDDVRAVARAFTGWTVERPDGDAVFAFRPRAHDREPKAVLGAMIYAGGEADGERVLDVVAAHPSTARFVAKKLARRFVADEPPPELVERLADAFAESDGRLAAVYAELFRSPEFWAEGARGAKTKTPFEFAASALRALGASYDGGPGLVRRVEQLGEPLYRCQPPTGFADTADAWVNAGALINRLNFGLDAAGGRLPGVAFDRARLAGEGPAADAGALVDRVAGSLLSAPASGPTRATIVEALGRRAAGHADEEPAATHPLLPQALGLVLGSPEFQKR
ncbi:MAG TPA: DUF1800 domain-containing protein [Polyangiaceae bacterium]|nr:DUF1800 domain-containing protein [Polyangiaceae bacterium]